MLNYNSTKQLRELLYNKLKLTCDVFTERGKSVKAHLIRDVTERRQYLSTGEEALQQMRGQHPIIEKILEYRKYKKIQGTYIKNWLK